MPESNRRTPRRVEIRQPLSPVPAIVGFVVVAVGMYLFAESKFASNPHPVHWAITLGGGAVGYGFGTAVAWVMSRGA
ncbi:MAG: hypothetical protein IVW36_05950 [Dehalococcoidia bacterium]|nr:hypothetical protein [Dehalococcoidia bacterium]